MAYFSSKQIIKLEQKIKTTQFLLKDILCIFVIISNERDLLKKLAFAKQPVKEKSKILSKQGS